MLPRQLGLFVCQSMQCGLYSQQITQTARIIIQIVFLESMFRKSIHHERFDYSTGELLLFMQAVPNARKVKKILSNF